MPKRGSPPQSADTPVSGGAPGTRRRFMLGGLAAAASYGLGGGVGYVSAGGSGVATADQPTPWFHDAFEKVTRGRPVETKSKLVKFDIPGLAENGNMVPYSLLVDSPMTDVDNVRSITVLSPLNPQAFIASFEFSKASGVARVQGRLRLAKTQDVLVIVEFGNGQLVSASRRVEVHVGGCGTG